jgi:predicted ATPase
MQYLYDLWMASNLTIKEKVVDDSIFYVVDQIKHGSVYLAGETPEVRIDVAKLYAVAVQNAVACSDYVTAYIYSTFALSLLPTNCWKDHYDLSLWFSIRTAKASLSLGDIEKTQRITQEIIEQCRSFTDKLPAYFLLATSKYHT